MSQASTTLSCEENETSRKTFFEQRLVAFYKTNCPEKLSAGRSLQSIIQRLGSTKEDRAKCFEVLKMKYGADEAPPAKLFPSWYDEVPASFRVDPQEQATPADNSDDTEASRRSLFLKRVRAFYAVYAPEIAESKTKVVSQTKFIENREQRALCFKHLEDKYGPEPAPSKLFPAWYDEVPRSCRDFGSIAPEDGGDGLLKSAVSFVYSGVPNPADKDDELLSLEEIHDIILRTYLLLDGQLEAFMESREEFVHRPWAQVRLTLTKKCGEEFSHAKDPVHAHNKFEHYYSHTKKNAGVVGDVVVDYAATLKNLLEKHDPLKVDRVPLLLQTMEDSRQEPEETVDDALRRGVEKIAFKNGVEARDIHWKHVTADVATNDELLDALCVFASKHSKTHKLTRSKIKKDTQAHGTLEAAQAHLAAKYDIDIEADALHKSAILDFLNAVSRDVRTESRKLATIKKNEAVVKLLKWRDVLHSAKFISMYNVEQRQKATEEDEPMSTAPVGDSASSFCDDVYELRRQDSIRHGEHGGNKKAGHVLRDRLMRFYKKYDPSKAIDSHVDNVEAVYRNDEKTLFKALVMKYGPEPEDDVEVLLPTRRSDFESLLKPYFEPTAEMLDELVEVSRDTKNSQTQQLLPVLRVLCDDGSFNDVEDAEERYALQKLYRFYNTIGIRKSISHTKMIIQSYKLNGGKYDALWELLQKKYHATMDEEGNGRLISQRAGDDDTLSPTNAQDAKRKHDEFVNQTQRLDKYFGKVAAHRELVDAAQVVSVFEHHYDLMWALLEKRFGVAPTPTDEQRDQELEALRSALQKSEAENKRLRGQVAALELKVKDQEFELEMHVGVATTTTTTTRHSDPFAATRRADSLFIDDDEL